ncbi:MAG TPA: sigma-70 family RNA polymerase sigma factor [Oceanobacillus sp.]|nr:sigma-70 family RNA polymerase sigma factor [Oceanobacillus sp.]
MYLCAPDQVVQRLLPIYNDDAEDRARAWNEWLSEGGSEPVKKFIRWTNGTTTDDDEILQETLIIAYVKVERGQYEDRNLPFTAFLKKIAWYKIMEASRRNAGQVSLDELYEYASDEQHEHERVEFWKEHEALKRGLEKLPPRRSKIMLLYETGYSTAEIAELLNIREELVRKEKSLGLRQLRETVTVALAG